MFFTASYKFFLALILDFLKDHNSHFDVIKQDLIVRTGYMYIHRLYARFLIKWVQSFYYEVLEIFQLHENRKRKFVIVESREQDRLKDTFKIAKI